MIVADTNGVSLWNAWTGNKVQTPSWPPTTSSSNNYVTGLSELFSLRYGPTFTKDSKYVRTRSGTYTINWRPSHIRLERTTSLELTCQWIRHRNRDILFFPYDYRGKCSDTHGNRLVIGHASGAVTFFQLTAPED